MGTTAQYLKTACLLQPHNQTMVTTPAAGNGWPSPDMHTLPGSPDGVPLRSSLWQPGKRQQVCTPKGRADIPTWAGLVRKEPGQPFQVLYTSKLERGHLALSVSKISALREGQTFCRRLGQEGEKDAIRKR